MSKREITASKYRVQLLPFCAELDLEPEELVAEIEAADPTQNLQYVPWLVRQFIKQQFRLEDCERVNTVLVNFDKVKSRLAKRDINQYTFYELDEAIDNILNPELRATPAEQMVNATFPVVKGSVVVYDGPLGQLAIPKTAEAARELGSGTKWCTTSEKPYKSYSSSGDLYVWRDKSGSKYQFHVPKKALTPEPVKKRRVNKLGMPLPPWRPYRHIQCADVMDRQIDPAKFEEHPVLKQIMPSMKNAEIAWEKEMEKYHVKYKKWIDKVPKLKDQVAKQLQQAEAEYEQRLVTEFNNGKRLRSPKKEMFDIWHNAEQKKLSLLKSTLLQYDYEVMNYCYTQYGIKMDHVKKVKSTYPGGVHGFLADLANQRWDQIKPRMAMGARSSYDYAKKVIKGRWPEQEALIATDQVSWNMYSRDILGTNNNTKLGRQRRDLLQKQILKGMEIKL